MIAPWTIAFSAALALATQTPPQPPAGDDASGEADIIVNGYPIRCHPRPNDPADMASANAPTQNWYFLVPDSDGSYRYEKSRAPGTAPEDAFTHLDRWRRAGDAMPSFVFRQPVDGSPSCIGRRPGTPAGAAQLQQQLAAEPYRCKSIRFTMFVATRRAAAWVWLNGGGTSPVMFPVTNNHGWTPVSIEWGPVEVQTPWLGFGVIARDGDIWFHDPKLEIIPDAAMPASLLRKQVQCRLRQDRLNRLNEEQPGLLAKRRSS